uniref:EGF-like domain-containing protein n=1 Tax=Acrobeloides nanus TaxID=290746 RepID=A0A914BUI5_9BILA
MNLVARQYILLFSLILQQHSVLTDFSSLKWYLSDYLSGNPWNLITGNVYKRLGDRCERSVDCLHVNNSICVDGECRCQSDYYPSESDDVEDKKVCKLAPGYKEDCQKDSKLLCRFPFVCSSDGVCDCPPGFLSNNTHCIRNCKSGYTSVGSPELSGGGKCLPNCPRSQPVRHEDRCYPLVGHSAHCLVDQQCSSVQNSICAAGPIEEERTCQCPLDFSLIGRKCIRKSKLGGECITNDDCLIESNTICLEGLCQCALGFIPEPMHGGFNQSSTYVVEHCIAEPTCPSTKGLEKLGQAYEDCSGETYRCSEGKYCRRWHIDSIKQRQYSVCCPIPKSEEYEEICGKFGMTLLIENSLQNDSAQPIRF